MWAWARWRLHTPMFEPKCSAHLSAVISGPWPPRACRGCVNTVEGEGSGVGLQHGPAHALATTQGVRVSFLCRHALLTGSSGASAACLVGTLRRRKAGFWAGDGPAVPKDGPHTHPPLSQWCGSVSSFLLLLDFPHSRWPFLLHGASGFLRWCSQPFLVGLALASCPACCSQPSAPLSPTTPKCWSPA